MGGNRPSIFERRIGRRDLLEGAGVPADEDIVSVAERDTVPGDVVDLPPAPPPDGRNEIGNHMECFAS